MPRAKNRIPSLIILLLMTVFVLLKIYGMVHEEADENLYFYSGKLMTQGKRLYIDFTHSHPPLPILIYSGVCQISCHFKVLKAISIVTTLLSAIALYLISKRFMERMYATMTVALFLFSNLVLRFSSQNSGLEITLMFFLWGILFNLMGKPPQAALFFALSILSGLYVIPLITVYLAIDYILFRRSKPDMNPDAYMKYLLSHKKHHIQTFWWTIALMALFHALFTLMFGRAFWEQVYLVWMKPDIANYTLSHGSIFLSVLRSEWMIFLIAVIGMYFAAREKRLYPILGVIIVFLAEMLLLLKIYDHYFVLLCPFAAVLGGYALERWEFPRSFLIAFICFIVVANAFVYPAHVQRAYIHGFTDLSGWIEQHTLPHQTISGAVPITPLVAFETNRMISGDWPDTYDTLFLAGYASPREYVNALSMDPDFSYFIASPTGWLVRELNIQPFLKERCEVAERFILNQRPYLVLDCRAVKTELPTPSFCGDNGPWLNFYPPFIQQAVKARCS